MASFAEDSGSRGNENGIALFLFGDDAEEFADCEKGRRQNTSESQLPLTERHSIDGNICGDPGTGVGNESVDASEAFHCIGEHALDLGFVGQVSLDDERVGLIEFAAKGIDFGTAATVMECEFCAFIGKFASHGGSDTARSAGDEDNFSSEIRVHAFAVVV